MKLLFSRIIPQKSIKRNDLINDCQKQLIYLILCEMIEFCTIRKIIPKIYFIECTETSINIINIIKKLKLKYNINEMHLVPNVHSLINYL